MIVPELIAKLINNISTGNLYLENTLLKFFFLNIS